MLMLHTHLKNWKNTSALTVNTSTGEAQAQLAASEVT